jgi:hypothetical protein
MPRIAVVFSASLSEYAAAVLPAGYRSHADVCVALRAHGATEIGYSVEGAALLAATFGAADAARVSVVVAGLHALEWIGVETALAIAARLAASPPRDRRVVIVALANPDGYRAIESDLRTGRRRFRRTNANGVDLNRNWPTAFVHRDRRWALWNWGGRGPASEPEVAAIVRMLDGAVGGGAQLDTALSLHSFGRKLLVPYGGRFARSPRHRQLVTRARAVQARLVEPYSIDQVSRWLPGAFAHGIEIDDFHDRYGACALLVECSFGGLSRDPATWLQPFHWYNPPDPAAVAADLAQALDNFVRGG